jgi:hypothetical protein
MLLILSLNIQPPRLIVSTQHFYALANRQVTPEARPPILTFSNTNPIDSRLIDKVINFSLDPHRNWFALTTKVDQMDFENSLWFDAMLFFILKSSLEVHKVLFALTGKKNDDDKVTTTIGQL